MKNKQKIKIYLTAVLFTFCLLWLEGFIGKIVCGLVGLNITMTQAIVIAGLVNFIIGFFNAFKYGKKKTT